MNFPLVSGASVPFQLTRVHSKQHSRCAILSGVDSRAQSLTGLKNAITGSTGIVPRSFNFIDGVDNVVTSQ